MNATPHGIFDEQKRYIILSQLLGKVVKIYET